MACSAALARTAFRQIRRVRTIEQVPVSPKVMWWRRCLYFVNIGLDDVGGVAAAGDRLNVSQTFQPSGRF